MNKTKVVLLSNQATFSKVSDGSEGYDLTCCGYDVSKHGILKLALGVIVEPPKGYYFKLYVRGSMSKHQFRLGNGVGIMDYDYRGEWFLFLRHTPETFSDLHMDSGSLKRYAKIHFLGKRVGQAILCKRNETEIEFLHDVEELSTTERGAGHLGSSGQ